MSSCSGWPASKPSCLETNSMIRSALKLASHCANTPLDEFVQWLASFKTDLIIEFGSKQDPMVQKLLRNKETEHEDYSQEVFESLLEQYFTIERTLPLNRGARLLYACQPKHPG